jgi:diguanylate cyclase (GGDEF)-like protein
MIKCERFEEEVGVFMKHPKTTTTFRGIDSPIMQHSTPVKMLVACFFSCIAGIVLMALLSHYLLMAVFICIIICVCVTTPLLVSGKISLNTACLAPMLLLCFMYTPLSWFTFSGLLGCTPYLSILFITIITLTYYRKTQIIILSLYGVLMLGLTAYWLATSPDAKDMEQIINILVAYVLTVTLIFCIVEGVKRRNMEINKQIMDISMRDDLTELLNRRAIEQVLSRLEDTFNNGGTEYALILLDIDKFKSINDSFGHNLGDSVLKSVAASIQKSIRSEDYAFRLGGDEFLLILANVDRETAYQTCEHIEASLLEVQGYAFPLTISKGCAFRSEGISTTDVLELADQRMYEAKRNQDNSATMA